MFYLFTDTFERNQGESTESINAQIIGQIEMDKTLALRNRTRNILQSGKTLIEIHTPSLTFRTTINMNKN